MVAPALAGCAPANAAPAVSITLSAPKSPVVWDCTELAVTATGGASPYSNPFDPAQIAVDATVTAPNGSTQTVPAFWCEPHKRSGNDTEPTGETAGFRVRFAPNRAGKWKIVVSAKDGSGTGRSAPLTVSVSAPSPAAPKNAGFLLTTPGNRYFSYSSGASAFLVGENVCWAGERKLADYDDWFPALGSAGGNFARLWMAWRPIETKATGLGRYDQGSAAYFDEVLRIAQKNGLRCMLAFGTYGEFTTGGFFNEGKWNENPYNIAGGGMIPSDKPDDFFTNAAAKAAYKNKLRYLVARYGAFTSLGMWEYWNEKTVPPAWYKEMSETVAALDPYRHPITNSYTTTGDAASLSLPRMDITQTHRYGDDGSMPDITPVIIADAKDYFGYKKPHLMGEYGISWRGSDATYDPDGTATNLHNGLWASAMAGNAGGAVIWWWDNYIHPKNLYANFTPLTKFAQTVAWNKRNFAPLTLTPPTVSTRAPETFSDFSFAPTGGWGDKSKAAITVAPDGTLGDGVLLSNLFNKDTKPEQYSVERLTITAPRPTKLVVQVGTVSDKATLRITVNGVEVAKQAFDASPDGAKGYESTKKFDEYGGIYQAVFNKDVAVNLPAGKSEVALENTSGDWLQITGYVLENFRSSRFAALRTVALQDGRTGETVLWLQDPESNWKNDRAKRVPATWDGVRFNVLLPKAATVRAEWWDTRTGKIVAQKRYANAKSLLLTPPPFVRDIACRIAPE